MSALTNLEVAERKRMLEWAVSLQLSDDDAERFIASIESSRTHNPLLVDEITEITSKMLALRKQ